MKKKTISPTNGCYELPVSFKHGEKISFYAGKSRFKIISSSDSCNIILAGQGKAVGTIVSPIEDHCFLTLEGHILCDEAGIEIDRFWISNRLVGTWEVS